MHKHTEILQKHRQIVVNINLAKLVEVTQHRLHTQICNITEHVYSPFIKLEVLTYKYTDFAPQRQCWNTADAEFRTEYIGFIFPAAKPHNIVLQQLTQNIHCFNPFTASNVSQVSG